MSVGALRGQRPKTHGGNGRQTAFGGALQRQLHLGQMKERFQNEEVYAGVFEHADLFGDVMARFVECAAAFAFDQLRAGHTARHERRVTGNLPREFHGGVVDLFGLRAITGPAQFLARAEEGERLQDL